MYIYIYMHTYTYVYMYVWFRIAWLGQETSSFWIDYGLTSCNLASQGFKAGATIFKWSNLLGGHADGINLLDQLDQSNLCGVIWLNLILVWSKLAWECLRWSTVSWKYIYTYIYMHIHSGLRRGNHWFFLAKSVVWNMLEEHHGESAREKWQEIVLAPKIQNS